MPKKYDAAINLRTTSELRDRVIKAAAKRRWPISTFIVHALEKALSPSGKPKDPRVAKALQSDSKAKSAA